jgi:hypothetical protein
MKNEIANIELYSDLKNIIEQSRKIVITNVNTIMFQTYWSIGKRIVEEEQNGNLKALWVLKIGQMDTKQRDVSTTKVFRLSKR